MHIWQLAYAVILMPAYVRCLNFNSINSTGIFIPYANLTYEEQSLVDQLEMPGSIKKRIPECTQASGIRYGLKDIKWQYAYSSYRLVSAGVGADEPGVSQAISICVNTQYQWLGLSLCYEQAATHQTTTGITCTWTNSIKGLYRHLFIQRAYGYKYRIICNCWYCSNVDDEYGEVEGITGADDVYYTFCVAAEWN